MNNLGESGWAGTRYGMHWNEPKAGRSQGPTTAYAGLDDGRRSLQTGAGNWDAQSIGQVWSMSRGPAFQRFFTSSATCLDNPNSAN